MRGAVSPVPLNWNSIIQTDFEGLLFLNPEYKVQNMDKNLDGD